MNKNLTHISHILIHMLHKYAFKGNSEEWKNGKMVQEERRPLLVE